ncbi:semaphorin-1A isoform X2 [Nilaparvata lugens]|uniref:semaphorin-1A isoform X1 n=1 Tax=Nilaparvata lugens TaxID=108931 RepID=UPI00193DAE83|nr:semaphorin-1A isoform X1 [Nilaparvata lugens]XP_039278037.1 semaphorin-1A isoform X2 [Nilaparvata lugens]
MCLVKGKDEDNCQNYIRIMAQIGPGKLLVCGTNSFKPNCREYSIQTGTYTLEKEKPGQAVCPYDPQHNSTAVFVDDVLYTGTVADFSGMDPIIYREPLQTEQYDSMSLNAPNFVSSMTQGDFVYFFFRETAVEYINCGKSVFSRVARVCKYDRGGPHRFRNRWTSFLKSRLNCSVQGDFPFYFNEIQSTTELIEGTYGSVSTQLLYAVFTTPANSIGGSAVCAFALQDISDTFEGNFKEQSELNSNWLPVQSVKVPDPRPGQCVNDSRTLPDLTLNFIKTHSLMDESVPSFFRQPIIIRTSFHYRFTQIAVDPQIKTPGGKAYDVLFIGTDYGMVLKTVNADSADSIERVNPVLIEEIQVFPSNVSIRSLKVMRTDNQEGRLIVVSDTEVLSLRLHRCDKVTSGCSECVALQDPYCAWDKTVSKCRSVGSGGARWTDEKVFYQSVATGSHSACPASKVMNKEAGNYGGFSLYKSYNEDHSGQASKESPEGEVFTMTREEEDHYNGPQVTTAESLPNQYSIETLVLAVLTASLAALAFGFLAGYFCGRKCHKDEDDNLPYPDTEYEYFEQRQNVNTRRMPPEPKLLAQEEVTYAEPVLVAPPSSKQLNSPKATLPRGAGQKQLDNNMFQFSDGGGYNMAAPPYASARPSNRDHFGTLRSQRDLPKQNDSGMAAYRDGFGTTRSVKKVYFVRDRGGGHGRWQKQFAGAHKGCCQPRGPHDQQQSSSPRHAHPFPLQLQLVAIPTLLLALPSHHSAAALQLHLPDLRLVLRAGLHESSAKCARLASALFENVVKWLDFCLHCQSH